MDNISSFSPEEEKPLELPNKKSTYQDFTEPTKRNYFSQLGLLIGCIGGGLVVGSVIGIVIFIATTHVSFLEIDKALLNPKYIDAVKVLQVVSTFFMFFVPAYIWAYIIEKNPTKALGFNRVINVKQIVLVLFIAWLAIYVGSTLAQFNEWIPIPKNWQIRFKKAEADYADQVLMMSNMPNFVAYLSSLLVIALAPAIFEEALFRGALQKIFVNWIGSFWLGIIITSIIFSAIHFSYYGFLTRVGLGVVLGLLYYYSKNILLNIFAHFINNALAITALYMYSGKGKLTKEALDDHFPYWYGIIAAVILIILLKLFKKNSEKLLLNHQ